MDKIIIKFRKELNEIESKVEALIIERENSEDKDSFKPRFQELMDEIEMLENRVDKLIIANSNTY